MDSRRREQRREPVAFLRTDALGLVVVMGHNNLSLPLARAAMMSDPFVAQSPRNNYNNLCTGMGVPSTSLHSVQHL